jgi:small-conductance mechanosensitive channel
MMDELTQLFYKDTESTPSKFFMLGLIALSSLVAAIFLFQMIRMILVKSLDAPKELVNRKFRSAFYFLFVIVCMNMAVHVLEFRDHTEFLLRKLLYIVFVIALASILIQSTSFVRDMIYEKNRMNRLNLISRRKIRTQVDFLQKAGTGFIILIALCLILMSFNRIREIGTSIIASAGVITIIVGLAAQRSLSNLMAGLQIAFTHPIKIDDVVVVENEWGEIEEITLTYVVVRIWDKRRLVLPISYFIEKPFQNWTRVSSDLIGTASIHVDYSVPIEEIRQQFLLMLQESALWDGKVSKLEMTEADEKCVRLRASMSAKDASDCWDLKCLIREKLICFIQANYPMSLPRVRAESVSKN